MNKRKAQKGAERQKRKDYIKAPTRCLETNFYNLENINEQKGSEEMTTGEVINPFRNSKRKRLHAQRSSRTLQAYSQQKIT